LEKVDYALARSDGGARVHRSEVPHRLPFYYLAPAFDDQDRSPVLIESDVACQFSIEGLTYQGDELPYVMTDASVVCHDKKRFELGVGGSHVLQCTNPRKIDACEGPSVLAVFHEAHRR
jgi:hypothetical protein